ncbi:MAG: hypothetical protein FWE63_03870 [Bacteroidales bacterium]|nr:hypothetical protein [Bacteroidales bacterium]
MKKITLIALLLALTWQVGAETQETSTRKKNELKLDVVSLIVGSMLKVEYEYLINNWSSAGVATFYQFSPWTSVIADDIEFGSWLNFTDTKMQLLGTYRLYFDEKPTSGFFIEGNMGLIARDQKASFLAGGGPFSNVYTYGYETYYTFGIGIASGFKVYNTKGTTLDIFVGGGWMFGYNDVYLRSGIFLGKRF